MPYGIYLSAAGAHVQNHRLEVLSHNLANINTPGFKQNFAVLQSRHNRAIEEGTAYPGSPGLAEIGGGVRIQPTVTAFETGPMERTGNKTHFAINDKNSFFMVQRGEEQFLTRAGGFLFNSAGMLTTTNGDYVLSSEGTPIQIDPTSRFEVSDDGMIQQNGAGINLMVVRPTNLADLSRSGDNLFKPLSEVQPVPLTERSVQSGALEKSAVNPTMAMMELIEASRAYESNLRLIQHQDQAYGNLLGRVLRE
jgi:flagellar basal-body rod protein FlgF